MECRELCGGGGVAPFAFGRKRGFAAACFAVAVAAIVVFAIVGCSAPVAGDAQSAASPGDSAAADSPAPEGAAARYDGDWYVYEDDVTAYIDLYRSQMSMADVSDEEWASFLALYDLTPERLRLSTIYQLVSDAIIAQMAEERGIFVTDDEVDSAIGVLKMNMALDDDDIWAELLEKYGQTREGLDDVYRQELLKQKVLAEVVELPTPTADQIREHLAGYVPTLDDSLVKHSYYLKIDAGEGGESALEVAATVEKLRDEFAENPSKDLFYEMEQLYGTDDDLKERGGANGWDCDAGSYDAVYTRQLGLLDEGGVSQLFYDPDEKAYGFIWVDEAFEFPVDQSEIRSLDLASVPDTLFDFLSDRTAASMQDSVYSAYLQQLVSDADLEVFPMPSDVPYNVDMSLADVQLEEVEPE